MPRKLFKEPQFDARLAELQALFATPESHRLGPGGFIRPPPSMLPRRTIVSGAYVDGREFDVENAEELWLPLSGIAGDSLATTISKDYELKPIRNFQPMYFLFPTTDIAEALVLHSFTIGGKPVLMSGGVIPCGGFDGKSAPKLFRGPVASTNKPITFTLKNISLATVVVYGYLGGLAEPE